LCVAEFAFHLFPIDPPTVATKMLTELALRLLQFALKEKNQPEIPLTAVLLARDKNPLVPWKT
jgi:hypothetical protein